MSEYNPQYDTHADNWQDVRWLMKMQRDKEEAEKEAKEKRSSIQKLIPD
jgi:hypothetical protein